jgi:tetraacyldisaccharide 4'-kinase
MARLHTLLPGIWQRRGLPALLLLPLSCLYGALLRLRRIGYRQGWLASGHPGRFVIVVGNVVTGGAGKTPTTIALVQHLLQTGLRVGVVSRGYGRTTDDVLAVQPDSLPQTSGDEPLLIRRHTGVPVWVGRSRLEAARRLVQAHPEVQVIVCDDGLQHLGLQRDLEICLMDDRGTGNGWLLPAGPLREPWPRRVDFLLHTHGQVQGAGFSARRTLAAEAINGLGQRRALQAFTDQPVDAVAGLARPQAFFEMLRAQGLRLADTHPLPDHHDFSQWQATASGRPLLCTEKDAVKLWARQPEAWAVPLQMQPEPAFWDALDKRLSHSGLSRAGDPAPVSSPHGQQTA